MSNSILGLRPTHVILDEFAWAGATNTSTDFNRAEPDPEYRFNRKTRRARAARRRKIP